MKVKLQMNDSLEVTKKLELLAIRLLDFLFFFFFLQPADIFFLIFIGILLIYNVMLVSNTQQIEFFFPDSFF